MRKTKKKRRNFNKKDRNLLLIPSLIALLTTFSYVFPPITKFDFFTIESLLKQRDHYFFYTNPGNLGDMLINYAEIQLFQRIGLNFTLKMYSEINETFDLILGGSGRFISNYMCGFDTWNIMKSPYLRSCIMLSASIRECDELVSEIFDERFTVLLREAESYEYCIRLNKKTRFIRANDMALYINISQIKFDTILPNSIDDPETYFNETDNTTRILSPFTSVDDYITTQYRRYVFTMYRTQQFLLDIAYNYKGEIVMFYFRNDGEKKLSEDFTNTFHSYDLPLIAWVDHRRIENIGLWCRIFLGMIDSSDIIVTDRLHVGIAAALLNKEVYMYDNTYGKASGIYETSLACYDNVHIIKSEPNEKESFPLSPLLIHKGILISEKVKPFINMSYKTFTAEFYRFSDPQLF